MKITIKYAALQDLNSLKNEDIHINLEVLKKKLSSNEIIIAEGHDCFLGWLRYALFWDSIPIMNILVIKKNYRGKGIGKQLVIYWEEEMKKAGYKMLLTSSQCNESAQHFYRKLGYKHAGELLLPEQPEELFFVKEI